MAEQIHNENATSLDAANWPSGGFADNAQLTILDNEEILTDLDRRADTTTGIDWLWIRGGRPQIGGDAEGDLMVEFDATFTSKPNFVWMTDGGHIRLQATNTVKESILSSQNGAAYLVSGTFEDLKISGSGVVYIFGAVVITGGITVQGDVTVIISDGAGGAIPLLSAGARCRVECRRLVDAFELRHQARVTSDNRGGTDADTLLLEGGTFVAVAGDIDAVTAWGGSIDVSQARVALVLGVTSFAVEAEEFVVPPDTDLVTVSNVARAFPTAIPGK